MDRAKAYPILKQQALKVSEGKETERFARVTYNVRVPKEGRYELWARVYALPKNRTTFDVAVDGNRRWFRALSDVVPGGEWRWVALNELAAFVGETTKPRLLSLNAGWHEITFWAFGPQIGVDALMLSEVNEFSFKANDAVYRNFKARTAPVALRNECEHRWVFEAENFTNRMPALIRLERSREGAAYFISDSTSASGGVLTTFSVSRATYVGVKALMKRSGIVNDTLRVKIDGRPWIVRAEDGDEWVESSKWGETESDAAAASVRWIPLEPGTHHVEVLWREPGVGFQRLMLEEGQP